MPQHSTFLYFLKKFDSSRLCFLLFYLLALLFVCTNAGLGLADPDYFWHVKTGEVIWATGALPPSDPFSYTATDKTLTHQAWLSQVIIFLIQEYLGDYFVLIFIALIASASWYISYRSARIFLPSSILSLLCALLFIPGMLLVLTARPQLFSFFFFSIFLHQLLLSKYSSSWRPLVVLPVVMAFWVNMHGAYIIGLGLLLAFVLAEGASALGGLGGNYRTRFQWFAIALVASLGASLVNPDGYERLLFPFQLTSLEVTQLISEWQALRLNQPFGRIALVSGVLFFSIYAYRQRKPDLLELGLPISIFVAGMTTLRYYPYTCLTLIPFLAQSVSDGAFSELSKGPLRFLARPIKYLSVLWTSRARRAAPPQDEDKAYLVHWLAAGIVFLVITPAALLYGWSAEQRDARLPVGAVDFVEVNGIQGNMLNSYNIGGYLIFRLYPDHRVFIDPRADLYGDPFVERYMTLVTAEDEWREILAEWGIDYAILARSEPLRAVLAGEEGFVEVYDDGKYSVLVRREPRFEQLIESSESGKPLD